jgi:hypothetical protein
MSFSDPRQAKSDAGSVARYAMSSENQRVRPVRQVRDCTEYEAMLRKINGKPSVHEMLAAYSPA